MATSYTYKPTQNPVATYGESSPAVMVLQKQLNANGANLTVDGKYGPLTQAAVNNQNHNQAVKTELQNNPALAPYANVPGGIDSIVNAYQTGDWSGVQGASGQPFSSDVAQKALNDSLAALGPAYQQQQAKDTADVTANLAADQGTYQNFLNTQKQQFQTDKNTLDTNAANNGVLFSSGRIQQQNNLKNTYDSALQAKQSTVGADIGQQARNFQYAYGNQPAAALSQYYNLGSQNYDPTVARNGVSSNGLNSVYNSGNYNFYGTQPAQLQSQATTRAAGLLANQANKLVAQNYKTQL